MTKEKMNYPDYIFYKSASGLIKGKCRVVNIHDGLITVVLQWDAKERLIPFKSLIELIKDVNKDGKND